VRFGAGSGPRACSYQIKVNRSPPSAAAGIILPVLRADLPPGTVALARNLIGLSLVHDLPTGRWVGRIVETEAYVIGDRASHAFSGLTRRNRSLFLKRGHAYVYRSYGLHCLVNVSSDREGFGAGVLLRALEPLDGIAAMEADRKTNVMRDLARGPGRLTQAMRITLRQDGWDLCDRTTPLWLGSASRPVGRIKASTRIGITREMDRMLRFIEEGNSFVSGRWRVGDAQT
jgi:DNA-3-methyladenine glycosylase